MEHEHLIIRVWNWIKRKPRRIQIILCTAIMILLICAARLNLFGDPYYNIAKKTIPIHLPTIDPECLVISLIFSYEIEDEMGKRPGKLGDVCYSGDRIFLFFKVSNPCWVTVIGVDQKGIHSVFKDKFSPSFVEKDKVYTRNFTLDKTIGNEIYYAIASYDEFDFEKSIRPHLSKIFTKANSKGPVFSKYQMELPGRFTQEFIYFKHLDR